MKTIPVALANHIATRETTLATAMFIERPDGSQYGFTTHDKDDVIGGFTYAANPGLAITDIVITSGSAVGNLELTTLHDETVFTTVELFNGLWRNSEFTLFRYNWASISDGDEPLLAGTFGEFTLREHSVVIELRDLRQYLQQSVGSASSKNCRYRLGDAKCRFVLNVSPSIYILNGTLTNVTSNRVFRDSGRVEADDWFGEGKITFNTGNNAGVSAKVMTYTTNGTFTIALPLFGQVQVGDTYTATVGCRKRFDEDCDTKFDNRFNFGGEPHRKGVNDLTKSPV